MEDLDKNQEVPDWVKLVTDLPGSIQESVGRSCAGCIASLVQLSFFSRQLYEAVIQECDKQIRTYDESI